MDPDPLSFYIITFLFVLNGLFVAAEYALISCNPNLLRRRAEEEGSIAPSSLWLLDHSERCVIAIQLAITICSLGIGWLGMLTFYPIALNWVGESNRHAHVAALFAASLPLILLHVVISGVLVKAIATSFPEAVLKRLAGLVVLFCQLTYPLTAILYFLANMLLKPFRLTVPKAERDMLSVKEVKRLFSSVPSDSDIGSDQARMIRGVVGFSETVAREIMTPRTDLVTVKKSSSLDTVVRTIVDSGFSRIPVRGERVDDVMGILLARDIIPFLAQKDARQNFQVSRLMREPYYIPGTKAIDELLNEFRKRSLHMAIILDEHGGVDGVVTLEDIIEEIVGDIYDESDEPEPLITHEEGGDCIIDGGMLVADVNELFDMSIPEGEYDTIAGFIFTCLGRIPTSGDEIVLDLDYPEILRVNGDLVEDISEDFEDLREVVKTVFITIEKVDGHRIELVRLHFENTPVEEIGESQAEELAS